MTWITRDSKIERKRERERKREEMYQTKTDMERTKEKFQRVEHTKENAMWRRIGSDEEKDWSSAD